MHIWLIQTGEIIPKSSDDRLMRTALLAKELASRGHEVVWWASAFEHQRKKWVDAKGPSIQFAENLKIILLKGIGYQQNVSIKRFLDHLVIANKFTKAAKNYPKPDIIINSIPEHNLAFKVQKYAEKNNIPTFVDLRDYWPDYILKFFKNSFVKKVVKLILVRDFYRSQYVLKHSNVLISMMDSMLSWGKEKGNRIQNQFDQVFNIGSGKPRSNKHEDCSENFKKLSELIKGKFNVLFIGTFSKTNNPGYLIELAKYFNKNTHFKLKVNFILAGDGDLFEEVKSNSLEINNIHLTGWLSNSQIAKLLEISSLGIIPINSDEEFFPNKAFLYFSGGLPVLSSSKGEIHQLINQHQLGYNVELQKPEYIVEKIIHLMENKDLLMKLKDNVNKIFKEQFDSDLIYKNYANLIEKYIAENNSHKSSNTLNFTK